MSFFLTPGGGCCTHARHKFHDIHLAHASPTTTEALARIGALYAIEDEIRGKVIAVIQDLGQTALADRKVRGVLAGNFLEHFDLLIDYSRGIVCLDDSTEMEKKVKGEHIAFSPPEGTQGNGHTPQKLIVSAHVPGIEKRMLRLQLDSGINSPLLYGAGEDLKPGQTTGTRLRSRGTDGSDYAFAVLASQDLQLGPHLLRQIQFVMPMNTAKDSPKPDVDGLLPTILFQRIYVNYTDHYVVLDSW